MKSIRLQGLIDCLELGTGEIQVDEPVRVRATGCIERMLDFVQAHPSRVTPAPQGFVEALGAA